MNAVYLVFAGLLIFLSFRSYTAGLRYLRYFHDNLAIPPGYTPFASIIAPCRGLDHGLENNLAAVASQDYPEYEIIFVVDDANDLAVPAITSHLGPNSRLVVAPKASRSSQKVENLLAAVKHADPKSEVYIFVDSDAMPSSDWLRSLVAPLLESKTGASTGYRWFLSEEPSFASNLLSAWNASIASSLGPHTKSNFCWGGSMAIRRDTFEALDVRARWEGTLSDDFVMTNIIREAGLDIVFVPKALTASVVSVNFRQMIEFTTRQMKITRVYSPGLWIASLIGSGVFISVMLCSGLLLIFSHELYLKAAAAFTLGSVTLFSVGKALIRLKAVNLVLPQFEKNLRRQRLSQYTFWVLTPIIFFCNGVAALVSRRLKWRGTTYELKSHTETVIISD